MTATSRRARAVDVDDLVERACAGEPRAVARLITLVENRAALLPQITAALLPHTGRAQVLGITGSPGVGKSTSTTALIASLRADGRRVGVLAVDPSSPFSGGALLGDRVRMQDHATDSGVFIRSMATRGHLGGLSAAAPQAVRVLDAAGFDDVLIETVGVGQAELDVASPGRHGPGAARAGHGRRHPGGQGGHPGGRRRLRRQQGRPRRRSSGRARPAGHAVPRRTALRTGSLARADRVDRRLAQRGHRRGAGRGGQAPGLDGIERRTPAGVGGTVRRSRSRPSRWPKSVGGWLSASDPTPLARAAVEVVGGRQDPYQAAAGLLDALAG